MNAAEPGEPPSPATRFLGPTADTRHALRLVFRDGVAYSVMVGVGEHYLAAFVLALGLGEVTAGLVATVPLLAGGLLQLVTPWGVHRLGSRRRWVVACAILQALAFLPLLVGAWLGRIPTWAVFAAAALYWAGGMAAGSAWNVWVERIVPVRLRAGYFAGRTSAVNLGVLVGLMAGGLILEGAARAGRTLDGFAVLFTLAVAARLQSARFLAALSEPTGANLAAGDLAAGDLALAPPRLPLPRRWPTGDGARLLVYAVALTTCTTTASPYFSPYMLRHLQLSYGGYTTLIGVALLTKVLVLPLAARLARRFGLVALMRVAWLGIAAIPALWLVSSTFPYLMGLQVIAGASWATHEYVLFLLIFETIDSRRRLGVLTAYNLGDATSKVVGSLLGALIFRWAGGGGVGYLTIFLVSSAARAACLVLLLRVRGGLVPARPLLLRPLAVRPGAGAWHLPILWTRRRSNGSPDAHEDVAPPGA